jgi:hypothetical protein
MRKQRAGAPEIAVVADRARNAAKRRERRPQQA